MRVVVDTNVFVSAALKDESLPAQAVQLVEQRGTLLNSAAMERQLFEVLARPHFVPLNPAVARELLRRLLAAAETVVIAERIAACRDPTNDKFLEVALNGRADFIVSGDPDLLVLDPFRDIPIVARADFVQGASRQARRLSRAAALLRQEVGGGAAVGRDDASQRVAAEARA